MKVESIYQNVLIICPYKSTSLCTSTDIRFTTSPVVVSFLPDGDTLNDFLYIALINEERILIPTAYLKYDVTPYYYDTA